MFPGATAYRENAAARGPVADREDATAARGRETDREDANFVVVGAPLDATTTFQPGTRFGPRHIRTFAEPFDDYDRRTDQYFTELGVADAGDVRAWDDVSEYLEYLEGTLRDVVWDDAVPLAIGGEHTVSLAGVRAVEPDAFVCLDAHLDLREAYDGNPLSHACVTRRILETESVEEAIVLGARTGSETEWERAAEPDVTAVAPGSETEWERAAEPDVTAVAPEDVGEFDLEERLAGREAYLSVDVDAADPGYAPGTGTMEPFGLRPRELRTVVRAVAPYAGGFDVVEVNDRDDGQTAALAAKLLREFVFAAADRESS